MALIGVSMLASCNSLEVTMPVGPRGEQGIQGVAGKDGLSAYELWVKAVQEKQIDYTGSVATLVIFSFILKARMALTVRTAKMARMVPMVLTARTANPPDELLEGICRYRNR